MIRGSAAKELEGTEEACVLSMRHPNVVTEKGSHSCFVTSVTSVVSFTLL